MWPENRKGSVCLAAVVLLGLILRLVWAIHQKDQLTHEVTLPDQKEYLQLGVGLRHGLGLSFFDARFGDVVYAYRTPGYPLFIAACDADPRAIRVVQALLDASTILAVYFLARKWLEDRAALFAAAIVAINPFLIYFSGLILSETLFVALLMWGMLLIIRAREPWRIGWIAGGLLLGVAALVRPSAIALPVLIAILAAVANHAPGRVYRSRWPAPVGLGMLLITLLVLFPWALRNRIMLGEWIWTSTNAGVTKYDGFNPDADGSSNQNFLQWMPWLKNMDETARSRYLGDLADDYIKQNPGHCLSLALVKIGRTWSPIPLSQSFGDRRHILVAAAYSVPLYLLALAGLARGGMSNRAKLLLLGVPIYFTVVHAASVGSLRYRLPAEPPLAVLAAAALPERKKAALSS
jgi:4-amino-4-deoxy-L-arabinose transferase-like glycosyltransferase